MSRRERQLRSGMRVRLNVWTIFGNRGPGTLLRVDGGLIVDLDASGPAECCRHEVAVMRDQTPVPPTERALRDYPELCNAA
jgi:hypothetical protein